MTVTSVPVSIPTQCDDRVLLTSVPQQEAAVHTPGPWVYDLHHRMGKHLIWAGWANVVNGRVLAKAYQKDQNDDPLPGEANARLIAAAPALLAACEAVKEAIDWERDKRLTDLADDTMQAYDELCDAIAKAKAVQP